MKVKMKLISVVAFGTIPKGIIKGLEDLEIGGQEEIIQTTALLRSTRILRRVLEICCLSNSSEKPSANPCVKNSQRSRILIIMISNRYLYVCDDYKQINYQLID